MGADIVLGYLILGPNLLPQIHVGVRRLRMPGGCESCWGARVSTQYSSAIKSPKLY